jgi:hypothetical protein
MPDSPRLVRVQNVTRETTVAERARVASSAVDRSVGLLRTAEVRFFMRYAIDAVFVAADGRVTKVVANLRPWRVVWWARGARDCLELPVGAAAASGTQVGDQLALEDAGGG